MSDPEGQLALAQRMKDAVIALKRGGIDRRTEANLEQGLRDVEELWQLFERADVLFQKVATIGQLEIEHDHAYYTHNVYKDNKDRYVEITTLIRAVMEERRQGSDVENKVAELNHSDGRRSRDDGDNRPTSVINNAAVKIKIVIWSGRDDVQSYHWRIRK